MPPPSGKTFKKHHKKQGVQMQHTAAQPSPLHRASLLCRRRADGPSGLVLLTSARLQPQALCRLDERGAGRRRLAARPIPLRQQPKNSHAFEMG